MFLNGGYPFSIVLSAVVYMGLALYALRYRRMPGALFFILSMMLTSCQAVFSVMELASASFTDKLFWRNAQQLPIYMSGILIFGLTMELIGTRPRVIARRMYTLTAVALAYLAMIFTDSQHHLMRDVVTLEMFAGVERIHVESTHLGLLFLLVVRLVGIWALVLLLLNVRKVSGIQRMQQLLLLLSIFLPYAMTNAAALLGIRISIVVSSLPSGILLFYALFQYKLLQVRPLAKDKVLEHMTESILVVDEQGLIIDANPAALPLVKHLDGSENPEGEYILPMLEPYLALRDLYQGKQLGEVEAEVGDRVYAVRQIPLQVRRKRSGSLLIFSDITERKVYERELIRRATTDGLTKLYNRQHFMELVERRLEDSRKRGGPISLLLLDLDDFKKMNDQNGHQAGDQVLEHFALLLREEIGDRGEVGRVGGEEFAVLLPELDGVKAYEVAERLRHRVEQESVPMTTEHSLKYTVSIGVAEASAASSLASWYQEADAALYASKNEGRNRTTIAG